jgi:uncharacterized repeat protein (TIGR02543 family)
MRLFLAATTFFTLLLAAAAPAAVQITVTGRVLVNGAVATEVIVGHDFQLEVRIQDTSTPPQTPAGVDGAFCSVSWLGARAANNDNIDDDFATTADVKKVINPVFQAGFISGTQAPGSYLIEDIGGASASRVGHTGSVWLIRLNFTALALGDPHLQVITDKDHFPIFGGRVNEVIINQPTLTIIEDPTIGFELTTLADPEGAGTVLRDPDLEVYPEGTEVLLTAIPATGFDFVVWEGDLDCSRPGGSPMLLKSGGPGGGGPQGPGVLPCYEPEILVTVDKDMTVSAVFVPVGGTHFTLTLNVDPPGSGTIDAMPQLDTYPQGAAVSLQAEPAEGFEFTGWSGNASGTLNPVHVVMNNDLQVTANFQEKPPVQQFSLSTSVSPSDGGTIIVAPVQELYDEGTVVSLIAEPNAGFAFGMWGGDAFGVVPIALLIMDSDKEVTAIFSKEDGGGGGSLGFHLAAEAMPAMGGEVLVDPDQAVYLPGTQVTLEAVPQAGYVFSGWAGAATGATSPLTLTINGDTIITAHFAITGAAAGQYSLDVNVSPGGFAGSVRVSPKLTSYPPGTVVTLQAEPAFGFMLTGWSGDASGSGEQISVVIHRDLQINAQFGPMLGPDCGQGVTLPFVVLSLGLLGLIARPRHR